jgi:ADP-ribose pyrophosphatase
MDWKLISSTLEYSNFMQVENRVYELPTGVTKDFDIKIGKSSAAILAITKDKKVIISEQFRPGPEKVMQELPGGVINLDDGETSDAGAIRELEEETGYTGDMQFVAEFSTDAYSTGTCYVYVATNCMKTEKQNLDYGEDIKVRLMELPEFIKQVREGKLTNLAAALLGLDRLELL